MNIVLFQPEIAYNTGSVGRTCVALGAKLWLVRPLGFQLDARHLRRAGLDYWRHLDYEVVDDWPELQRRLECRKRTSSGSFGFVGVAAGLGLCEIVRWGCSLGLSDDVCLFCRCHHLFSVLL